MPANSTMPKAEALTLPAPAGDDAPRAPRRRTARPRFTQQQEDESHPADRAFHAALARLSGGISPIALLLAYTDWLSHLATSPQRQLEISQAAVRDARRLLEASQHFFAAGQGPWSLIKPQPQDRRFARPEWEIPPFNLLAQAFLQVSNGGTTRPPACAALPNPTRRSSSSRSGRCWTCWRHPISPRPIPKCCRRRSRAAARISCPAGRTGAATGCACCRAAGNRPPAMISSSARTLRRRAARSCTATS